MKANFSDFSSIFSKQLKPAKGMLLLAEPFMDSPEFGRSVIFLTEFGAKGCMGFIIGRRLNISPAQALEDFPDFTSMLYYGGPVCSDQLFYLHTLGKKLTGSTEIIPGIYSGGDFEMLKSMIKSNHIKPSQVRFFAGYSGWEANQLTRELKENSWIVAPLQEEYLFGDMEHKSLWKEVLRAMGGRYSMVSEFPENPSLN